VGRLADYSGASALGFPPVTAPPYAQAAVATSTGGSAGTSPTSTTGSSVPSNTPGSSHQDNKTPTAIGAGIGVPLGVAAIGLLAFLFWRESRRRGTTKPRGFDSQDHAHVDHSATVLHPSGGRRMGELPSSQTAWELDHRGAKPEMGDGMR